MKYLPIVFSTLFLFACENSTSENAKIEGKWRGSSWMVNEQTSNRDASEVTFEFMPSGSYSAAFAAQAEAGNYRLEGTKLYTTADGQAEKMVEIDLPNTDTLIMKMNRAGTPETLILVKEQ